MFSQTVEYALRAVIFLANRVPDLSTTDEIAEATQVPKPYLSKVLQGLSRHGLVVTQRGIGGGAALAKLPETVTILDVVNAVEPIQRIRTCPLALPNHGSHLCPLHHRMDQALATVEEAFRQSTLAEILAAPTSSIPLCNTSAPPNCPANSTAIGPSAAAENT